MFGPPRENFLNLTLECKPNPQKESLLSDGGGPELLIRMDTPEEKREDEEAEWKKREKDYKAQIAALEEEQETLRDAWSEIVRANMAQVG